MVMQGRQVGQARPGAPWLVILHGLLGSGDDWQPLLPHLADWPVLLVDLPGHGLSRDCRTDGFPDVSRQLNALLAQQGIETYWLMGYSLGGRIAMYHACHGDSSGLRGLLVEGGHPGLTTAAEREARALHDAGWAQRFRREPIGQVLADWYRQPVFADLSDAQRAALTERRAHNQGNAVADMLEATSLSRQPLLAEPLCRLNIPFGYLCGSLDNKFQALAARYRFRLLTVDGAGHNAHQANPAAFGARIREFVSHPAEE
ncbi:2-succinyl-6-hydroxy-2,4-cyclohexadiene-1-carboxylate synthase [Musicola paradisiaca]